MQANIYEPSFASSQVVRGRNVWRMGFRGLGMVICRAWAMDKVVAMVRIRMKIRHSFFMFLFSRLAISTLAKKIAPIRIPARTTKAS